MTWRSLLPVLLVALACAAPSTAAAATAGRTGDTVRYDAGETTRELYFSLFTAHDAQLPSDRVIFDVTPRATPGAGCTPSSEVSVACDATGAARIVVVGPASARLVFMGNSGSDGVVPVHVTSGTKGDNLDLRDHQVDVVESCGGGHDYVDAEPRDVVAADCETVTGGPRRTGTAHTGRLEAGGVAVQGAVTLARFRGDVAIAGGNAGQAAAVRVRCPASATTGCGGHADATFARGRASCFGGTPYAVDSGRTAWISLTVGAGCGVTAQGATRRRFFEEVVRLPLPVRVTLTSGTTTQRRAVSLGRRLQLPAGSRRRLR